MREVLTQDAIPGWQVKGDRKAWTVKDGVLACSTRGGGWIETKAHYQDFVIELEYQIPPGGNSGVFLHGAPGAVQTTSNGMEVQILDDAAKAHRDLKPTQYSGSLYEIAAAKKRNLAPADKWNTMRITVEGDHIVIELNGETVVDANGRSHPEILDRWKVGSIGLQKYGNSAVSFRHIRIAGKPIDPNERTRWWRDAKFGMFIHWGVYSLLGQGEWVMQRAKIPATEYEKLPPKFNPLRFDAAEWVGLARQAGQQYMVITSKHHDGFAMFDSKTSNYDIIDATPFKRDPIKELALECQKQRIRFGLYHSVLDWHHPDHTPIPKWDTEARASHTPELSLYYDYMQAQVKELCTNYGPLACIWWDGAWAMKTPKDQQRLGKINAMIRTLQPDILINNRANNPEDFDTPEQFIPPTGLTNPDGSPKLWENCMTLTTGHGAFPPTAWWGYDKNETEFKTAEFSIRMLIDVVSKGGNLLLNVGPTPEGTIRPEEVEVLLKMGDWLKTNGEAIYGTTASPFKFLPFFGRATVKGHTLYLHVFQWPEDKRLVLPGITNTARSARLLANAAKPLKIERAQSDIVIHLPDKAPDPYASVVAVQLDGPPQVEPFTIRPDAAGVIKLPVLYAELRGRHGQRARYETSQGKVHLGNWTNKNDYVAWQFDAGKGGIFNIAFTYAADEKSKGGKFGAAVGTAANKTNVDVGGGAAFVQEVGRNLLKEAPASAKIAGTVLSTGGPTAFDNIVVGRIEVPAGKCVLIIKADEIPKGAPLMNLRQVTLNPVK